MQSVPARQRIRHLMDETSGSIPRAIPPHPPLVSGGWYHGMSLEEVLGPGRYPIEPPADKSVGTALAVTLMFGPAGLCYISVRGGLICTALTVLAAVLIGASVLLIAWPLAMVCCTVIAAAMRREYEQL
jgi:hypothetical protein